MKRSRRSRGDSRASWQVIGIDPGKSGGLARIVDDWEAEAARMPPTEHDVLEHLEYWLSDRERTVIYLERAQAFPGQGVSSSFQTGRGWGFLRGIVCALRVRLEVVSPTVWQRSLACLSGGDKNVTKRRAQELFPYLKITHAVADALLISEYARRLERKRPMQAPKK